MGRSDLKRDEMQEFGIFEVLWNFDYLNNVYLHIIVENGIISII